MANPNPKDIRPAQIQDQLQKSVLGQEDVIRQVALSVYKHTTGMVPGNILLIGNSGTGKTTIMIAIQRLYAAHEAYAPFRVSTVTRWRAPQSVPPMSVRVTCDCSAIIGSNGPGG